MAPGTQPLLLGGDQELSPVPPHLHSHPSTAQTGDRRTGSLPQLYAMTPPLPGSHFLLVANKAVAWTNLQEPRFRNPLGAKRYSRPGCISAKTNRTQSISIKARIPWGSIFLIAKIV